MIRISRVGSVPGLNELSSHGSVVFLGDEAVASSLPDLQPRLAAEIPDPHGALIWVGPDHRLTTVEHDADGRLVRPLSLPYNVSVPVGSLVDRDDPDQIVIHGAGPDGPEVRLPLEGPRAGALHYRGVAEGSAAIRYSHPRPLSGDRAAFGAFRFQIFTAASTGLDAEVHHDPARPFDPVQSRAVPLSPQPRVSCFRTRWGSPVTLAVIPPLSAYVQAWDPELATAYTTLDGPWAWAADDESGWLELMAGISSTEYLRAPTSWNLRFVAGAPAYAHQFDAAATGLTAVMDHEFPLVSKASGVPYDVTTAWLYLQPAAPTAGPTGAGYYSQPDRAPLFTPGPTGTMLRALNLEAAPLPPDPPPGPAPAASFPAAPYAGLDAGLDAGADPMRLPLLQRFESEVLAAARTEVIYGFPGAGPRGLASSTGPSGVWDLPVGAVPPAGPLGVSGPSGPTGPTGPVTTAVTPQGMVSAFSPDYTSWRELVIATNGTERVVYSDIHGSLREAMLANQLFLVVSDPGRLYQHCSPTYQITAELVQQLQAAKAPASVIITAQRLTGYVFASRSYFEAELRRHLSEPDLKAWLAILLAGAERQQLTLGGWTFDLASHGWGSGDDSTLLILKLGNGDLRSLAGDLTRWTLATAFNADPVQTQRRLLRFLDEAVARAAHEPELQPFVDTVLAGGRGWTGLVYLNVPVPTSAFPPDLAALAAGFPAGPLHAHHLGVTLSPVAAQGGALRAADSSLFGLILYDDPTDLVFQGAPYDFKVLSLRVRFANSAVASFTSQVELLVARLFGELTTLRGSLRGSNLLLDGTLQKGAYQFSSAARSVFAIDSQVLDQVTVSRARFVTVPGDAANGRTRARFILDGDVGFRRLGDFDLFGFGPAEKASDGGALVVSNLVVSMDFDPSDPTASREFSFVAGQASLDPASSRSRPESLPRRFPLSAAAILQSGRVTDAEGRSKVAMPPDLGFIPVESPLGDGELGEEWYGLEMTLSFGSPGALAPSLGFSGALLAAWSPAAGSPNVAVGIRLPGSAGGKKSLTIMGPLKLGIGRLALLRQPSTEGYLLRLQNVALSFLGLSFPSGGRTDALLFGDPDPRSSNSALGWYLAYKKDEDKKDEKKDGDAPPSVTAGSPRSLTETGTEHPNDCPPCRAAAAATADSPRAGD